MNMATGSTNATTEYLSIADAAKRMPGRVTVSTVWRWATDGYRGVRLRTQRVGWRLWTTPAWVDEFLIAIEQANDQPATPAVVVAAPKPKPNKPRRPVRERLPIRK